MFIDISKELVYYADSKYIRLFFILVLFVKRQESGERCLIFKKGVKSPESKEVAVKITPSDSAPSESTFIEFQATIFKIRNFLPKDISEMHVYFRILL